MGGRPGDRDQGGTLTADLTIVGGTVVTPEGLREVDISVADGQIEAIGPELSAGGARTIDATGMLVLPGVIDVHTHLRLSDAEHPDRFGQDTTAAAHGGTTTVLTFNNPGPASPTKGLVRCLAASTSFGNERRGSLPSTTGCVRSSAGSRRIRSMNCLR